MKPSPLVKTAIGIGDRVSDWGCVVSDRRERDAVFEAVGDEHRAVILFEGLFVLSGFDLKDRSSFVRHPVAWLSPAV